VVKHGCRFLKRNRKLSSRKRCAKPHYLSAKVGYSSRVKASRFRLKKTRLHLAKARYAVTIRATDAAGNSRTSRRIVRVR
jgi:hypothetical protein